MWDRQVDFISIGGGIGGLSGAITAAHHGLDALVLESSPLLGGVSALSLGILWVAGNHLEAEEGIADGWEQGHAYVRWMGGGFGDEEISRAWCEAAPKAVRYFADIAGVRWRLFHQPDYYFPAGECSRETGRYLEVEPFDGARLGSDQGLTRKGTNATLAMGERLGGQTVAPVNGAAVDRRALGGGLAAHLVLAARHMGVELVTEARTLELVTDNGRVEGVVVSHGTQTLRIRARRGILLATSGFDRNLEKVRLTDARIGHGTRVPPAVRGDHLRLAGLLGAQVLSSVVRPQWIGPGFRSGGAADAEGIEPWHGFSFRNPHAIMVNRAGQRFCDESWGPSYVSALSHVDPDAPQLKNQPFWAIFDSQFRARYAVGPCRPGEPLPDNVRQADSLDELAVLLGIDPLGLQASVARFNRDAAQGRDDDFGRGSRPQTLPYGDSRYPNPVLGPVEKPPFYGIALEAAAIGIPTMGLACDATGRVLDWNGEPITGLYAAGNSMAMTDLGIGYNSGIANTRGMTFGHLAALDCCCAKSAADRMG